MIPYFERQADECTLCSGTVLLDQTPKQRKHQDVGDIQSDTHDTITPYERRTNAGIFPTSDYKDSEDNQHQHHQSN